MADADLVGRCSSFRVTVNDGSSRQEIHCLATDEQMARRRMEELGYTPTHITRVSSAELRADPLYSKAEQWALYHDRMGEPQVDCYLTSKIR